MPGKLPINHAKIPPTGNVREYEEMIVKGASHFVVFWIVHKERRRTEYPTLKAAIKARADHPRKMIYAVHKDWVRTCMIGPSQYRDFLLLRGETKERKLPT